MTFEVLMSCMHQSDDSIIKNSNLMNCRVLVVNQCNVCQHTLVSSDLLHQMLNTGTRGLSVSRNLAVQNTNADVCLLSDDDEVFVDNLERIVLGAYEDIPDADVIIFMVRNLHCKIRKTVHRLNKMEAFRVSSVQISFRINSVKNKVHFDERIGSGTQYGAGEDNKFVCDCIRNKLKVYFVPLEIAVLKESESQWFKKYDGEFFYKDAIGNRYVMGLPLAIIYSVHFLLFKRKLYKKEISFWNAIKQIIKGLQNRDLL